MRNRNTAIMSSTASRCSGVGFKRRLLHALVLVVVLVVSGCNGNPSASDSGAAPVGYAQMQRETEYVYYTGVFASACRDADLGDKPSGKYLRRIHKRAREIIRTATLHPDDKFDDNTRPSDHLHKMAGFASCVPDISKRLEIAARDLE